MKNTIWGIIIFIVVISSIISVYANNAWDIFFQILFVTFLAAITVFVLYKFQKNFSWLEHWAMHHKFEYKPGYSRILRYDRFNKNRNKSFFKSRSVKDNFNTAPAVLGTINGRKFWFYGLVGVYPFNKRFGPTNYKFFDLTITDPRVGISKNEKDHRQKFTGWCMELATHKIPVSLIARRNYMGGKDEVDTESIKFEKLYHVDVYEGHGTLQLLDPMMIHLIMESGVTAFEFSETSVVLYYTLHKPSREKMENMLNVGLKVAEQVDRNFPLGKYEKK